MDFSSRFQARAVGANIDPGRENGEPALSRQIKTLEDELGVPLLERSAHSFSITPAGDLLLREASLQSSDIGRFIIAGAFGAYIDVQSGIATGLFPPLPAERFVQVGNAAGLGAQRMLASSQARSDASDLAARCRYVELSTQAGFQKAFLHHIAFDTSMRATP